MDRLHAQLHRLYLMTDLPAQAADGPSPLVGAEGQVRALVLELAQPAAWDTLSAVWQGVQAELALPAPAIAVSGVDSHQLWFSLEQPVPAPQAQAFLQALQRRYLPQLAPARLRLLPAIEAAAPGGVRHARWVPQRQVETGHWSAFVTPDLAALFADDPWLDLAPSPEAQADLLSRLQRITPQALQQALELLTAATPEAGADTGQAPGEAHSPRAGTAAAGTAMDPKGFLLAVMNDPSVQLALRIEAAKALLPYQDDPRRR